MGPGRYVSAPRTGFITRAGRGFTRYPSTGYRELVDLRQGHVDPEVVEWVEGQAGPYVYETVPILGPEDIVYCYDPRARVRRQKTLALVLFLILVTAGSTFWLWSLSRPAPSAPSVSPTPIIPTGASFSFRVSSLSSEEYGRAVATSLESLGLPVVVRTASDGPWPEVFVGPYVAADEADAAQHTLVASGFSGARVLVDESLGAQPVNATAARNVGGASSQMPALLLVPAPGRLSLVLEMSRDPQQVFAQRVSSTSLQVDIGPVTDSVRSAHWNAPAGVPLLSRVSVGDIVTPDTGRMVRATLTLPLTAQSKVRLSGRRVYIDLFWAPVEHPVVEEVVPALVARRVVPADTTRVGRSFTPPPSLAQDPPRAMARAERTLPSPSLSSGDGPPYALESANQYQAQVQSAIARFEEIQPFLFAATSSPSPDVLRAVGQTIFDLEGVIRSIKPPAASSAAHATLASAAKAAGTSVGISFAGDRTTEAYRAATLLADAKKQIAARR